MTEIRFHIGVDGGGTGCRVRIRDAATRRTLGEGRGGPANIRLGLAPVWRNLSAAIDEALTQAGLDRTALDRSAIGLGLAGIVEERDGTAVIADGPRFGHAVAVSDAHIACLGAFDGADGSILITGTGSAGFAIVEGRGTAMFGWGFEVDDKGSAAALGRAAIRAALDGRDGLGPASAFTHAILAVLGIDPPAIVRWISEARPRDFGTLAPIVMEYAYLADRIALSLVKQSANEVETMIDRLRVVGAGSVCLVGGMSKHVEPWLSVPYRKILTAQSGDAVDGALILAGGRL